MTALAAGAGPPENKTATRFVGPTRGTLSRRAPDCHPVRQALYSGPVAIDPESVGWETPPIEFNYTWRDTVLYALGVGASPDGELDYLYEGRGPKVLPTFCTIPTFVAFDALVDRIACDRTGMVHHSQRIQLFKPVQPDAKLEVRGRVDGLFDLKRMAMTIFVIDAYDHDGEVQMRGQVSLLLLKDGGFGGQRPPRSERERVPGRDPDFVTRQRIPETQALLYRLCGDFNPLHADPRFATKVGFDKPILHGLCTFGYAGRAVVGRACDGDPGRLVALQGQFSNPVFPGDTIVTKGWNEGERVILTVTTEERPHRLCLSHASALVR